MTWSRKTPSYRHGGNRLDCTATNMENMDCTDHGTHFYVEEHGGLKGDQQRGSLGMSNRELDLHWRLGVLCRDCLDHEMRVYTDQHHTH